MADAKRVGGVGRKLLKVVQSSSLVCRVCVRVGMDITKWFPVNIGLRQRCVMCQWVFNV